MAFHAQLAAVPGVQEAMSARSNLRDLLLNLFTQDELLMFLRRSRPASAIVDRLPFRASGVEMAASAVQQLVAHGLVNEQFFDDLSKERPGRESEIRAVQARFGAESDNSTSHERHPIVAIENFIAARFTPAEIRVLIQDFDADAQMAAEIPFGSDMVTIATQFRESLQRRGMINGEFFDRLLEHRPMLAMEIHAIRDGWNELQRLGSADILRIAGHNAMANVADAENEKLHRMAQATDFIRAAQDRLRWQQRLNTTLATACYIGGIGALVIGAAFLWQRSPEITSQISGQSWQVVVALSFAGLTVIGMLGAIARALFVLGRSFMIEALTASDRSHAIGFGEFYLLTAGDDVDWDRIREAFEHWNTGRGSGFSDQKVEAVDPKIVEPLTELVKAAKMK